MNLIGSLLIGLLWAVFESVTVSENLRVMLLVGLLGAFTTFSTFSMETLNLLRDRQLALVGLNLLVSCGGGLALAYVGMLGGRLLCGILK